MVHDLTIKKLFAGYLKTSESELLQSGFNLAQAPQLLRLMENSPDPGRFMELVMDYCNKLKRKDEGTFYTPQHVAEKMFRQTLKVFVKNNPDPALLLNIKVLDPACGSGEFIIAALNVLLEKFRSILSGVPPEELLLRILKNNLYGIDCNANAIELIKRRLAAYGNISDGNFIVKDVLDFPNAAECFAEDIKFDIVIGNPPYVSYGLRNVGKIDKARAAELRRRFPFSAEYKLALYALFMEFAINSTAAGGVQSFIVPDSFLCGQYFTKLRNFMLKNCSFEYFYLIKQKLFKAVPGSLVIYIASRIPPASGNDFQTVLIDEQSAFDLPDSGYTMLQNCMAENYRQRFRLFFDSATDKFVRDMESKSICKLGDLLEISSGLIARGGKSSIIADNPGESGCWQPGLTSGRDISNDGTINYQGKFINADPAKIKSGLKNIDYSKDKILIRQTGDRIVCAVDRRGLLVLNNIHVGIARNPAIDLERLSKYLNSSEMLEYYQAVTLEANRPMAQIDLETLKELPMKELFLYLP